MDVSYDLSNIFLNDENEIWQFELSTIRCQPIAKKRRFQAAI